jgi:hypothetical protein
MNRMIGARLSVIAVLLIVPLALMGCRICWKCQNECNENLCPRICPDDWWCWWPCTIVCFETLCALPCALTKASQYCAEDPDDECVATWEEMQLAAIEFCEEYPAECQQAFDSWLEASDPEGEE